MKPVLSILLFFLAAFASAEQKPLDKEQSDLLHSATIAEDQGHYEEAIVLHKRILLTHPSEIRSINTIAGLFGKLGKFDQEISWANQALALDNRYEPALINLGNGYAGQGDVMKAIIAYSVVLTLNPKSAQTHYNLGILHEGTGSYERAEENYKNAISSDPQFVDAYINLAALYGSQGRLAEAKPLLVKAIELDPSASDAKEMLEHVNASMSKP